MRGIRAYLEAVLRLRINPAKSAVARPWSRVFLGYSVTAHRQPRLRIARPACSGCGNASANRCGAGAVVRWRTRSRI